MMRPACRLALAVGIYFSIPTICQASLSFIGNGYVELNPNSSGDSYYKVDSYNSSPNSPFSGTILSIQAGQSLYLGGEIQTYQPESGVTVTLHYAIDQNSSFSTLNLNYFQTQNNNDWWHNIDAVNLDNSLSVGTHTLYVYFSATDGSGTIYDNNSGANYSATFNVTAVPEPIAAALPIFAGLVLMTGLVKRLRCKIR